MKAPRGMLALFIASLLVAVACLVSRYLPESFFYGHGSTVNFSLLLSLFWIGLFAVAMSRFRRRGLWLLIGAPFALYYPILYLLLAGACLFDRGACP
jgi:hypothetical protein